MKAKYTAPTTESISINTYEIMQGMNIPISGGTTPEESDAKQIGFDDFDAQDWDSDDFWLD